MKFRWVETKTPREGRATVRQVPGRARECRFQAWDPDCGLSRNDERGALRPTWSGLRCVRPFDSSDRRILNAQPQAHCDSARRTGAGRYPVQRLPWHDDASAAGVAWVRTSGVSSGLRPVSWHGVTYRRNDGRGALRQTWSGLGRRAGATRQAIWPPRPPYLECAPASALRFSPSYRRRPVPRAAFEVAQRAGRPAPRAPRRRISPAASARLQLRARTRPDSGR